MLLSIQSSPFPEGIYSIYRMMRGRWRVSWAKGSISSSFNPWMATILILMGKSPTLDASSIPAHTLSKSSFRVIWQNLSFLRESRLILILFKPAFFRSWANSFKRIPLVVRLKSCISSIRERREMKSTIPFLTSGSPPVRRILEIPSVVKTRTVLNISS